MTGPELQAKRKKLSLTQEMLAKELEVSRPTIISWEKANTVPNGRLVELAIEALERFPDCRKWYKDGSYSGRRSGDG